MTLSNLTKKLFLGVTVLGMTIGLVLGTSAIASVASAQESTTYDFEDDLVTGDLVRPDGEMLQVRRRGRRASLIRVREHFIPEMLKSVENL
ncbi:MAG: hypothetical protein U0234_05155 [Sandaracinus sp.]